MSAEFSVVSTIAYRQHGRATRRQMLKEGVTDDQIKVWARKKLLIRQHEGVYAVGHAAPSRAGDLMTAVLACGPETAAISHLSAACFQGLLKGWPDEIEVTVPTTAGLSRDPIRIHRTKAIPRGDTWLYREIRMTTLARTLLDLAPRLSLSQLTHACHEAWIRNTRQPQIEACIARNPRKPGRAKLIQAMGADVLLSELVVRFKEILAKHGLPLPRTNVDVAGHKVDCYWPEFGVVIELHSYQFHGSRQAFEADLQRKRRTNHVAFSWGDVFEREEETVAEVRALLQPVVERELRAA